MLGCKRRLSVGIEDGADRYRIEVVVVEEEVVGCCHVRLAV